MIFIAFSFAGGALSLRRRRGGKGQEPCRGAKIARK
jgi:hypothetical protein